MGPGLGSVSAALWTGRWPCQVADTLTGSEDLGEQMKHRLQSGSAEGVLGGSPPAPQGSEPCQGRRQPDLLLAEEGLGAVEEWVWGLLVELPDLKETLYPQPQPEPCSVHCPKVSVQG